MNQGEKNGTKGHVCSWQEMTVLTPQLCYKLTHIVGQTIFWREERKALAICMECIRSLWKQRCITHEAEACPIVVTSGLEPLMKHWHLVDKPLKILRSYEVNRVAPSYRISLEFMIC